MMVLAVHWRAVGHMAPRSLKNAKSTAPATTNRVPAMRNGGMVSTATRMAR